MSLIRINVSFNYYTRIRITPIYIDEEELQDYSFDLFKDRILREIPHLRKATSLRLTINENGEEVDLSLNYFNLQLRGLMGASKIIQVNAIEFESPAASSSMQRVERDEVPTKSVVSTRGRARKSLILRKNTNEHDFISDSDDDLDSDDDQINKDKPKLPLDRFLQKQKETVANLTLELDHENRELEKFDEQIQRASDQNIGKSNVCGKCHLKLGHTKKVCSFSPCKSVFSCGILSKHSEQKAKKTALEKTSLDSKITLIKHRKKLQILVAPWID